MANVTEISQFDTGIYQLETTDPLEGGSSGVMNYAIKGLANRTKFLFDKLIPKNRGWFSGFDVGGSSGPLSVSGDIASAVATVVTGDGGMVLVTMSNAMNNMNYKVVVSLESNSTDVLADCELGSPVFKKISTTQFQLGFIQFSLRLQNIKVHIDVLSLD